MRVKSKRKFRYAWVHPKTRQFVASGFPGAKRKRISIAKPSRVKREKKSGKFSPTGETQKLTTKTPKRVSLKKAGAKRLFSRRIKLTTQKLTVEEVVYEVPFHLVTTTVNKRKRQMFEPSKDALDTIFAHELVAMNRSGKFFSTAVVKINVIFRESNSQPEDSEEWITIPIGRRIPVDEPGATDEMYAETMKFLLQYDVWAINIIQLSFLRLPI